MFKKLKSWLADDSIYMASLLVLIGVASFGLGRLSVVLPDTTTNNATVILSEKVEPEFKNATETLSTTTEVAAVKTITNKKPGLFVASKAGTKFHKVTCPGAKQIKEENKIYFNSVEEAKASGYTAAANCPGL